MTATVLDFNRVNVASSDLSTALGAILDEAALSRQREGRRDYLGASLIGSDCLRKIQYSWQSDSKEPARTRRIFERGHLFEDMMVRLLSEAGFRLERGTERCAFTAADGRFRGHADGAIVAGPELPGMKWPALWEMKALGSRGWKNLQRDGLAKAYPAYAAQVAIYQAYMGLDENPALFTAVNADTCEIIHLAVPYDAELAQATSDRAVMVIQATAAGELLERVASKPDDWRCKMCSWREKCWA